MLTEREVAIIHYMTAKIHGEAADVCIDMLEMNKPKKVIKSLKKAVRSTKSPLDKCEKDLCIVAPDEDLASQVNFEIGIMMMRIVFEELVFGNESSED